MWSKGAHVVLRYVEPVGVVGALPMTVLADAGVVTVLYMAGGSTCAWPTVDGRPVRDLPLDARWTGEWGWAEREWHGRGILIVHREGNGFSLWHFLNDDGSFAGWYVNLEQPWVRTELGFDTRDHTLDLWVEPGGEWRWKDEDELESAVASDWYSRAEADAIRAEGERVLAEWPFPTGWEGWRKPEGWEPAKLPPRWDAV
jgi:hypothetical protein